MGGGTGRWSQAATGGGPRGGAGQGRAREETPLAHTVERLPRETAELSEGKGELALVAREGGFGLPPERFGFGPRSTLAPDYGIAWPLARLGANGIHLNRGRWKDGETDGRPAALCETLRSWKG